VVEHGRHGEPLGNSSRGCIVRIGAVEYLNARPLVHGLAQRPDVHLLLARPSRLADMLRAGRLDLALIPSVEYLRNLDYKLVPGICIASHGDVLSVLLVCRRPPRQMRRVALDQSSRSSAALCHVLFALRYRAEPKFIDWSPAQPMKDTDADGFLVIGDAAMQLGPRCDHVIDLGGEWQRLAGLPFIYAVWAGPGVTPETTRMLHDAKRTGLEAIEQIAETQSHRLGIPAALCRDYLANHIHYDLGPAERQGLRLFQKYAADLGLCPTADRPEAFELQC